jgi:hypothetical protein
MARRQHTVNKCGDIKASAREYERGYIDEQRDGVVAISIDRLFY